MLRRDGRESNQLRPVTSESGLLNKADGSAQYSIGATSVIAAVYGPMEVKQRDEILDRATVQVTFKPNNSLSGMWDILCVRG
jgi:exosome complex component RRP46